MSRKPAPRGLPPITADIVKACLQDRHAEDIFVAEALAGSGGSIRFDGWAMDPTWQRERCVGYEIKVSRRDFLGDKKWTGYLPYCTEFLFVCPTGVIQPSELPPEVGLLWVTANGSKLYQKKPPVPRPISAENLSIMLRHVLMWRYGRHSATGRDQAESWLKDAVAGAELDQKLKDAIRKAAGALTIETLEENARLLSNQAKAMVVEAWLERNGIDISRSEWDIIHRLDEAKAARASGISTTLKDMTWDLQHTGERLIKIAARLEAADKGLPDPEG